MTKDDKPIFEDLRELVVGWKADINGKADFWSKAGRIPGSQDASDLILLPPASLANHAVIVAQSGSGKSFLLGRILEEIALKTRGRTIVLDPNGDFRRFSEIVDGKEWKKYNVGTPKPKYPHEPSRDDFAPRWKSMDIAVYGGPRNRPKNSKSLQLPWITFPISFLSEDLDPIAQSQVYHCHEFVKAIISIESLNALFGPNSPHKSIDSVLSHARTLLKRSRSEGARTVLEKEYPKQTAPDEKLKVTPEWNLFGAILLLNTWLSPWTKFSRQSALDNAKNRAVAAAEFVTLEIERFYFGRAKEYSAANLINESLKGKDALGVHKCAVIDLPSFADPRTSRVVLSSIVETVWQRARLDWANAFEKTADDDDRVPVFLVIEEAHNIVPSGPLSPSATAIRDQVRTIAAEGRKYGVFLILVTQRPDKIDPLIVSECENRAVMRIADSAVETTSKLLSLQPEKDYRLSRLSSLEQGRFILAGPWASLMPDTIGLAAMRRTEEGGRSLQSMHWAQPEPFAPKSESPQSSKTEVPPITPPRVKESGEKKTDKPAS